MDTREIGICMEIKMRREHDITVKSNFFDEIYYSFEMFKRGSISYILSDF